MFDRNAASVAAVIKHNLDAPLPAAAIPRMIIPGWAYSVHRPGKRADVFSRLVFGPVGWRDDLWVAVKRNCHMARRLPRHAASIIDLLMRSHSLRVRPLYLGTAAALVLLLAVYWPAGRLIRHFVDSRQLLQTAAPFASGDVVLFRPHRAEDPLPGRAKSWFIKTCRFARPHRQRRVIPRFPCRFGESLWIAWWRVRTARCVGTATWCLSTVRLPTACRCARGSAKGF